LLRPHPPRRARGLSEPWSTVALRCLPLRQRPEACISLCESAAQARRTLQMRDTFPMSRMSRTGRAIECGKTLDETLEETLEETLADTLPGTPARLGSPYDWTTGFEPAATVEHGAPGAHRQLHAITGAQAHHPGRPQPSCALPPPRRRPTTRPTRCHPRDQWLQPRRTAATATPVTAMPRGHHQQVGHRLACRGRRVPARSAPRGKNVQQEVPVASDRRTALDD
jgi:hypothetical protein